MSSECHHLTVWRDLQVFNPSILFASEIGGWVAEGGECFRIYKVNETVSISYNKKLPIWGPVESRQVLLELSACLHHHIVFPDTDSLVRSTTSKQLLLGVNCTSPELCLRSASKVTMDQCLNLLTIHLVNFNDFCSFSAYQDSFWLLKVVERAYSCREFGHWHQVNNLLL